MLGVWWEEYVVEVWEMGEWHSHLCCACCAKAAGSLLISGLSWLLLWSGASWLWRRSGFEFRHLRVGVVVALWW